MVEQRIRIDIGSQTLELLEGPRVLARFAVSTAALGTGEQEGSEQTPRGLHEVRAKIGAGAPEGAVFAGRRPTGEICDGFFTKASAHASALLPSTS